MITVMDLKTMDEQNNQKPSYFTARGVGVTSDLYVKKIINSMEQNPYINSNTLKSV